MLVVWDISSGRRTYLPRLGESDQASFIANGALQARCLMQPSCR